MNSPILLITYRKYEFIAEILEEIIKYQPSKLYISRNKAKDEKEIELTNKITEIIARCDFPFEVEQIVYEAHLPISQSVVTAINYTFRKEEKLIVLEDDVLPNQSFFTFCDEMLYKYKDSEEIGCINGCNLNAFKNREGVFLSDYSLPFWGWATWRKKWKLYDLDSFSWSDVQQQKLPFKADKGFLRYFFKNKNLFAKTAAWDVQWSMILMYYSQKTILPCSNLITNKGFDKRGTYTTYQKSVFSNLQTFDFEKFTTEIVTDSTLEKKYHKRSSALLQEILKHRKSKYFNRINVFLSKLHLK